jgi:sugar-specific transcriptional regulator TrmB
MSINENTRETLREMGLNAYEIDAYIVLLEGGQMTAMEISREASVPYSKIYEVLNSLKQKGWVKSVRSSITLFRPLKLRRLQNLGLRTSTKAGKTLWLRNCSPCTRSGSWWSAQTC